MKKKMIWFICLLLMMTLVGCNHNDDLESSNLSSEDDLLENEEEVIEAEVRRVVPYIFFVRDGASEITLEDIIAEGSVRGVDISYSYINDLTYPLARAAANMKAEEEETDQIIALNEQLQSFWADSFTLSTEESSYKSWAVEKSNEILATIAAIQENPATKYVLYNFRYSIVTIYTDIHYLEEAYAWEEIQNLFHLMVQYQYLDRTADSFALLHIKDAERDLVYEAFHAEPLAEEPWPSQFAKITLDETSSENHSYKVDETFWAAFPKLNYDFLTVEERLYELYLRGLIVDYIDFNYILYPTDAQLIDLRAELLDSVYAALADYSDLFYEDELTYTIDEACQEIRLYYTISEPEIDQELVKDIFTKLEAYHMFNNEANSMLTIYGLTEEGAIFAVWENID